MSGKDGCKFTPEAATISGTFVYLVREIVFLTGKGQGSLISA